MTDPFFETKRDLYELMQRMKHGQISPPTPAGVTPTEARTMMVIGAFDRADGDVRPGRVAEMMHTTPSAQSQTFKSLEEKGLIERHRASNDYRAVSVSLTEEGARFAAEGRRLHDEHMDNVLSYVGVEDMQHLVRILRKVVEFHERDADGTRKSKPEGGDTPCA